VYTPAEVIAPPVELSCTRQLAELLAVPVTIALNAIVPPAIADLVWGLMEIMTDGLAVTMMVAMEEAVGSATDLASTWYVPSVWEAT
jgi:hypothetical protein